MEHLVGCAWDSSRFGSYEDDEGFFEFFLGVLDGVDVGVAFVVNGVGEFGVAVD